jgi:hypothetical protein
MTAGPPAIGHCPVTAHPSPDARFAWFFRRAGVACASEDCSGRRPAASPSGPHPAPRHPAPPGLAASRGTEPRTGTDMTRWLRSSGRRASAILQGLATETEPSQVARQPQRPSGIGLGGENSEQILNCPHPFPCPPQPRTGVARGMAPRASRGRALRAPAAVNVAKKCVKYAVAGLVSPATSLAHARSSYLC